MKKVWAEFSHHLSKVTGSASTTALRPKQAKELPTLQEGATEIATFGFRNLASQQASQPASKRASQPASKRHSQRADKHASKRAGKRASQRADKHASERAGKRAMRACTKAKKKKKNEKRKKDEKKASRQAKYIQTPSPLFPPLLNLTNRSTSYTRTHHHTPAVPPLPCAALQRPALKNKQVLGRATSVGVPCHSTREL